MLISILFKEEDSKDIKDKDKDKDKDIKLFNNFVGILNEYSKIKFDAGNNFKKINKLIE